MMKYANSRILNNFENAIAPKKSNYLPLLLHIVSKFTFY